MLPHTGDGAGPHGGGAFAPSEDATAQGQGLGGGGFGECHIPGVSGAAVVEALPMWSEAGEMSEHRQYIFHYHTMMCPQFANGYCPRSGQKGPRATPPQCFCFHFESQRRRPLVDTMSGQIRYWDVLCEHVAQGEECYNGDLCPFAHTREEISYHAAKYKTKLCNDRDCRGEEVCCFAHGENELRNQALERYSYWSVFGGGGMPGSRPQSGMLGELMCCPNSAARSGATGALYHPKVYKHRFCASYPNITGCRRGEACAFAHAREEIRTPLLSEDEEQQRPPALTNDFFMCKFKTLWCPIGVQHDWQTCVYAHNYQDARRHPGIGYGPRPCPYWKRKETTLEYSQRCPLGVRCPFSHGAKEQLYHPAYFKTVTCQDHQRSKDWPSSSCPRNKLCAFWHKRSQQRTRASPDEDFNYKLPIGEARLQGELQADFLSPPFKLLSSLAVDGQNEPELTAAGVDLSEQRMDQRGGGRDRGGSERCDRRAVGGWAHQDPMLCGPGVRTPATPSTALDSDEAASSTTTGSDHGPVDGSGAPREVAGQEVMGVPPLLPGAQIRGQHNQQLQGMGQMMTGGQQMMFYPMSPQQGCGEEQDMLQAQSGQPFAQQYEQFVHQDPYMQQLDPNCFYGGSAYDFPQDMGHGDYGQAMHNSYGMWAPQGGMVFNGCGGPMQPYAMMDVHGGPMAGGLVPGTSAGMEPIQETSMPTYNGFIHFKESEEGEEQEEAGSPTMSPSWRRKRSNSF